MVGLPTLWSFRRCPYAMRARLALKSAGIRVIIREIMLKDKPEAFLACSQTRTVPVLVLPDGQVIEESRDIMFWALQQSGDPEGWLHIYHLEKDKVEGFINRLDDDFKSDLDRYKYASRYADEKHSAETIMKKHRSSGAEFISELNEILSDQACLSGPQMGIMDYVCLPFIRQFRLADQLWFDKMDWPFLHAWLQSFLVSRRFSDIMEKYPVWAQDQEPILF